MATIGDKFPQPEVGFKRLELENAKNLEVNGFTQNSRNYGHSGTIWWNTPTKGQYVEFVITTSEFRLLGPSSMDSGSANIYIDDILVDSNINFKGTDRISSGSPPHCTVTYIKTLDILKTIKVKIESNGDGFLYLDIIDYIPGTAAIGDVLNQPDIGWKRLDDKDILDRSYDKVGDWQTGISASYHGGGYLTSRVAGVNKLKFKFKGTKFRIISCYGENRSSDARFEIDGVSYNYNLKKTDSIPKTLVFEKLELEDKIHEVVLYAGTGVANTELFLIDAIDINEDGYLIASIGTQLPSPEAGWKRIDDSNSSIKYSNGWSKYPSSEYFNGSLSASLPASTDSKVRFKFYGTKLRLFDEMHSNRGNHYINIDGIIEKFSSNSSIVKRIALIYEKLNLSNSEHNVEIGYLTGPGHVIGLDCIDIDNDGEILESDKPFPMLPQPEVGWKRSDNLDNVFNYKGDWLVSTDVAGYYNKSILQSRAIGDTLSFNFAGDKLRIISEGKMNHSNLVEIELDGIKETISTNKFLGTDNKCAVVFEKTDLDPSAVHKCIITNKSDKTFIFDAVDIDSAGIILPILSRDYEFPIAVIEEEELVAYSSSLINGEEQLLITPTGKLYLTDGNKGFISIGGEVDLSSYYTKAEVDIKLSEIVATDPNSHKHANASTIDKLGSSAGMLTYDGMVIINNSEYSFKTLPIKKPSSKTTAKEREERKLPWLN